MRLAIAGAGMIVHDMLSFIHDIPGVELAAIASTPRSLEKVQHLAAEHGIPHAWPDYDTLLADETADTVYVASPNHLHYEMVKKALEHGKNVICEKPFTSNDAELKELVALAAEKDVMLLEAISTQYLPNTLKIKELLERIGNVRIVVANYSQYSSRYNAFKEGVILPAFDVNKSGGALMDLNIYNIHLMVALFGAPQSVSYAANVEKGIDTSGIISLDYGSFEAVLIGAKDCKAPIVTTIQGDKGCIVINAPANQLPSFTLILNDGTTEEFNLQNGRHRMAFEFENFVQILADHDKAREAEMLEKSLTAMEIATQARKSGGIIFPADNR